MQTEKKWVSLDFRTDSPTFINMVPTHAGIIPDRAEAPTDADAYRVGIFCDEMPQNIITRVVNYNLDAVQLCGNESPTLIRNLRHTLNPDIHPGIQFWKVLPADATDEQRRDYADCVDRIL